MEQSQQKYTLKFYRNPAGFESDDVRFVTPMGVEKGKGFVSRKTQKISLTRCPDCGHENYAMNVIFGQCAFCGFNANNVTELYKPKPIIRRKLVGVKSDNR